MKLFLPFCFLGIAVAGSVCAQGELQQDKIKLKNGSVLEGRILTETENTLTVRIGPGQVVELEKRVVANYARVSRGRASESESASGALRARNEWFRLKSVEGKIIGTLHMIVRRGDANGYHVEEQWSFVDSGSRTLVSRIETVDSELRPKTCFYREAELPSNENGRVRKERLLRGEVNGNRLELSIFDGKTKEKREVVFQPGNLFPLIVDEMLRSGEARGAHSYHASIYDPMEGLFELRRYELAERVEVPKTLFGEKAVHPGYARLIERNTGGRIYRQWISAEGKILLMEVNGIHLVAEPIDRDFAVRLAKPAKIVAPASYQNFAGVDVYLPRATWRFDQVIKNRHLKLLPSTPDSLVEAVFQPASPEFAHLQGAAERMLKRWILDNPWFDETGQQILRINGRECLEINGKGKLADGSERRTRALFLPVTNGHMMLVAQSNQRSWEQLAGEFSDLTRSVTAGLWMADLAANPGK